MMHAVENIEKDKVVLHQLSAFVTSEGGGNPAGVVLDAEGLSEVEMQAIATRAALSETVFVSEAGDGGYKLDFFTPNKRVADCGHATVAAFSLLHTIGRIGCGETFKEIVDGRRRITVEPDGAIFMEQRKPRYESSENWGSIGVADLLDALGLRETHLDPQVKPVLANVGVSFALIGLTNISDLAAIDPDRSALLRISEALDLVGFYPFAMHPRPGVAATARMFAPRFGIAEESATGMAAGALASALYDQIGLGRTEVMIEQGRHMLPASPSELNVRLGIADGRVAALTTGGYASMRSARSVPVRL